MFFYFGELQKGEEKVMNITVAAKPMELYAAHPKCGCEVIGSGKGTLEYMGRDMCAKDAVVIAGNEVGLRATAKDNFCSYGERRGGVDDSTSL